jgi:hypothetical protein
VFAWIAGGKPRKPSLRIAEISSEIRTEHLPTKILDRYRYINLLDEVSFVMSVPNYDTDLDETK